jgi:hypothetical protein
LARDRVLVPGYVLGQEVVVGDLGVRTLDDNQAVDAGRRQVPAPPDGYVAWRLRWLALDRYMELRGRRES